MNVRVDTVPEPQVEGGEAISAQREIEPAKIVKRAPAPKFVAVKIIQQNGATALVEWVIAAKIAEDKTGFDWRRAFVPLGVITPQGVAEDDLAAGEPYGVRWEKHLHLIADKNAFAQALRQVGIWTVSDMAERPWDAQAAINQAYQVSIRNIILAAKKET